MSEPVTVRLAVPEDMPRLLELAKAYHYKARLARIVKFEDCAGGWEAYFVRCMAGGDSCCFVAPVDPVAGVFTGHLIPMFMAPEKRMGLGGMIWVDPAHQHEGVGAALFEHGERWAFDHGAVCVAGEAHRFLGADAMKHLYVKRGFEKEQTTYMKVAS